MTPHNIVVIPHTYWLVMVPYQMTHMAHWKSKGDEIRFLIYLNIFTPLTPIRS